ncbi:DNA-directed RNA polymerase subunit RPB1 [uncultured virus]|nr:DNA-directed RNA polymerase subunit RPB1 [uncultured virus]
MDSNIYLYDEDIRTIDHIDFNILSNEETKNISALGEDSLGIDIPDLYDNMEPKRGGLIDTRMGSTDNYIDCSTCGLNSTFCPGHFGHIDLAESVFHMGYINFVKKILSCICLRCSKLLIYKNEDELMDMLKNKSGKARFADIRNVAKNITYCQKQNYGCGTPVSKIKLIIKKATATINIIAETNISAIAAEEGDMEGRKTLKQVLTPENCYDILKNISDTDCMIMGIDPKRSRPEDMIYKVFPVPPVAVRPSTKADFLASSTMEDDLTHKLADIIKANIRIRKYKESINDTTAKYTQDHLNLLQYHVATYYDNDSLSLPRAEQRGKVSKSISSRLKGKEGK